MMPPARGAGEIPSLTGLRGLAATLVMVDHLAAADFTAPFPLDMLPHCYIAVDMFMVLSGFILAMTYEDRLQRLPRWPGYRLFIARRVARLFPLYAVTTLVCFGLCRAGWLTFLHPDTSVAALGANLVAIQTWAWPGTSLNGPGWSISTEWLASLLFPLLVPAILGRGPGTAVLAAVMAVAGMAAVTLAAMVYGHLFDIPSPGAVNVIAGTGAVARCLGEFVVGMCCWRLRSRVPAAAVLGGNACQLGLVGLLLLLMQSTTLDLLSVAACALLVLGLSFEASVVAAGFRSAPLLWLGRLSYSIYLVHITMMPVRDGLAGMFGGPAVPWAWPLAVGCAAALALAAATLTVRWIERPGQRALLRLLGAGIPARPAMTRQHAG